MNLSGYFPYGWGIFGNNKNGDIRNLFSENKNKIDCHIIIKYLNDLVGEKKVTPQVL
jgi:hypothetical protein